MFFLSCLLIFAFTNTVYGQNTCTSAGVVCSRDCNAVWFCTGVGATPIVVDNCQSRNLLCNASGTSATCVAPSASTCQTGGGGGGGELPIECIGGGLIPDPYNCLRGFVCSASSPTPIDQCDCTAGTYWNIDNQCGTDPVLLDGCCNQRDPSICPEGAVDGTFGPNCYENYYYVCAVNSAGQRVIHVLRCNDGEVYYPGNHTCITASPDTTTITTTTETTTIPTTTIPPRGFSLPTGSFDYDWVDESYSISTRVAATCTPYIPPSDNSTEPPPPVSCSFNGQVIPDPNDTGCTRYYVCDENLQPILRECEPGTHLDCTNGCNCVFGGNCP